MMEKNKPKEMQTADERKRRREMRLDGGEQNEQNGWGATKKKKTSALHAVA